MSFETGVQVYTDDSSTASEMLEVGGTYIVTFDGVDYTCRAWQYNGHYSVFLGNGALVSWMEDVPDTNEPFAVGSYTYGQVNFEFYVSDGSVSHQISIQKVTETATIKLLDFDLIHRVIEFGQDSFAFIGARLTPADFIGAVVKYEEGAEMILACFGQGNGFYYCVGAEDTYTYNPASGYLAYVSYCSGNAFDVSQPLDASATYSTDMFEGAALSYNGGDPVIAMNVYQSGSQFYIYAVEPVLKDQVGNVVHDFSMGPIYFDSSTGVFAL